MGDIAARLHAAIRSQSLLGVFEAPGTSFYLDLFRAFGFPAIRCEPIIADVVSASTREIISLPQLLILALPPARLATGEPDRATLLAAAKFIAECSRGETYLLVIDPPYPGSTRRDVQSLLQMHESGANRKFCLACASAIRDDTGRIDRWVVGGEDAEAWASAVRLLGRFECDVVTVSSFEAAEAAGALISSARGVLEALANEWSLGVEKMGLDLGELLDASGASDEFPGLRPGPGDADPRISGLNWALRGYGAASGLIERAGEVNAAMPARAVARVTEALNDALKAVKGTRILVLGIAGANGKSDRNPALEILRLLRVKRAVVCYHDPGFPELTGAESGLDETLASTALSAEVLAVHDAVIIAHDLPNCDWEFVVEHSQLVIDTRRATRNVRRGREKIVPV